LSVYASLCVCVWSVVRSKGRKSKDRVGHATKQETRGVAI